VEITNTYVTPSGDLEVAKAWLGSEAMGEQRPGSVTVQLQRSTAGSEAANVGGTVELSADNGWAYLFTGLPLYDANGSTYYYSVVELGTKGYAAEYRGNGAALVAGNRPGAEARRITIENTFLADVGSITATKEWRGAPEGFALPEGVTVALYKGGAMMEGSERVLNSANNWSATWSLLELGAAYSVRELSQSEDWAASYSGDVTLTREAEHRSATVINTFIPVESSLVLTKEALDEAPVIVAGKAELNYKITVTNNGNRTLTDVTVEDAFSAMPEGASIAYVVNSDLYTFDEATQVFTIGTLAPGGSVTILYAVEVDREGNYKNGASASGNNGGDAIISGKDDAETNVTKPGLALRKEVIGAASRALSGSSVSFSFKLTVANNEEVDFAVSSVRDVMSSTGSRQYTVTTEGVVYNAETNSFVFEERILKPGEAFEINYSVAVSATGTYTNVAVVSGYVVETGEPVTATSSATVQVTPRRTGTNTPSGNNNIPNDPPPLEGSPSPNPPGNGTPGSGTPGVGTPGNGTPGDGTPGDGTSEVDIIDGRTPLTESPELSGDQGTPGEAEISDGDVPLGTMPKTGILDTTQLWLFALCISALGFGIVCIVIFSKREKMSSRKYR